MASDHAAAYYAAAAAAAAGYNHQVAGAANAAASYYAHPSTVAAQAAYYAQQAAVAAASYPNAGKAPAGYWPGPVGMDDGMHSINNDDQEQSHLQHHGSANISRKGSSSKLM